MKCLERRRKNLKSREALNYLGLPNKLNVRVYSWKCCLCFTCKKISEDKATQLVDFNYAMLRAIYAFYLSLFSLFVLAAGIFLAPVGYLATLVIKVRILLRSIKIGFKNENTNLVYSNPSPQSYHLLWILMFVFTGFFELLLRAFSDTC